MDLSLRSEHLSALAVGITEHVRFNNYSDQDMLDSRVPRDLSIPNPAQFSQLILSLDVELQYAILPIAYSMPAPPPRVYSSCSLTLSPICQYENPRAIYPR